MNVGKIFTFSTQIPHVICSILVSISRIFLQEQHPIPIVTNLHPRTDINDDSNGGGMHMQYVWQINAYCLLFLSVVTVQIPDPICAT